MNELTEKKTPEQLGAEIRMYVDAGRRISLLCGIEIGKRLVQAKEMLQHGEWLPWLERETEFSDRSAARYMKLFDEYGASQQGLFGPETNSPTLSNLPISKAFALLSVPESERIEFAEEVDAENISVRELEEKIKERERQVEALRKDLEGERSRGDDAIRAKLETENLLKTQDQMLTDAKNQIAELSKLNKELESRPVEVAVETVRDEKAIAEAAKKAEEKTSKEYKKMVTELQKKLTAAEKERDTVRSEAQASGSAAAKKAAEAAREAERLRAELEAAKKQLKTSDADVTAFGIRFNSIQTEWSYLTAELEKVRQRDPEKAEKLQEAVRQMLNYFRKEVDKDV